MEHLAEIAERTFQQSTQYHTIAEGIESWLADATVDHVLVITGSLTVVAEARRGLMEGM